MSPSRRTTLALVFVVTFALLVPGLAAGPHAFAQSAVAACRVQVNDQWTDPVALTLDQCADTLGAEIARDTLTEIYGLWDVYYLYAHVSGDVYWAPVSDGTLQWAYLGSWRLTLDELLALVQADLNDYWSAVFDDAGATYYPVVQVITYDDSIATPCGPTLQYNGFYCSTDHSIYIDDKLLELQMDGVGDFAAATILAHEWGHAIQAQLGLLGADRYSIEIELQADCLAGAYAAYASDGSTRLILEQGDLEEGATNLFLLGDTNTAWSDPTAHGTGDQRYAAFWQGYQGGAASC